MAAEAWLLYEVLKAWGAHPRIRVARINTGVGWFNDSGPCRRTDRGARPVRFNPPGTADICGLIAPEGRLLMIECKAPGGEQRKEQRAMQRVVTEFGGLYVLARCLADVDAALFPLGITR
jgi:hypothetical protein